MRLRDWLKVLGRDLWHITENVDAWKARLLREGEEFRRDYGGRPGVVTLPSGLQYEVLQRGEGPCPEENAVVVVHYEGRRVDGLVFDSSYSRGEPLTVPLRGLITGWAEGLQLMPVGSRFRLVVPPDLAYGSEGAGYLIGPNSTLLFEVELLEITTPEALQWPKGWERGYVGGYRLGEGESGAEEGGEGNPAAPETTHPPRSG